jgi:transcriptional regulator with XRE-family HTH domain
LRLIDRLYQYLEYKKLTPYAFEQACGISNGYLNKQLSGKGSMGSEILEKIYRHCTDLNLLWLITGEGRMLQHHPFKLAEDKAPYQTKDELVQLLKDKIQVLQQANADKDKIIRLLEKQLDKTTGRGK